MVDGNSVKTARTFSGNITIIWHVMSYSFSIKILRSSESLNATCIISNISEIVKTGVSYMELPECS